MRRASWNGGWWSGARRVPSPNFGPRPAGTSVSLAIVHSISLPPGRYRGDDVARLFTNRLDDTAHPYFAQLRGVRVSAHFFIRRQGRLVQFVSCDERAWHAGPSTWDGRADCNDFSIGVELEGLEGETFDPAQYRALSQLLAGLCRRYPIEVVVGHEHVAPGRKHDPGSRFDWQRLSRTRGAGLARFPFAAAER